MGKFNEIIRSDRLHILAELKPTLNQMNKYKKKLNMLSLKKKTTISFLYEGHSISSANSHAFFN